MPDGIYRKAFVQAAETILEQLAWNLLKGWESTS